MYSRLLWQLAVALPFTLAVVVGFTDSKRVFAQLTPDDTLGAESSIVTPQQLRDLIQGGAIRDGALFHSFDEFNVGSDRGVFFDLQNNTDILNIFTRVTGGNVSNILGTLGVLQDALNSDVLGNANLFLLNPNGITFGGNANLQLNGSFFATTADGFGFDNFTFSASGEEAPPPLLTISIPNFLDFRNNAGNIAVNGSNLRVNQGQNLSLVGGNISIDNTSLGVDQGTIQIVGLSGNGRANLGDSFTGNEFTLGSIETGTFNSGSVTINESVLNATATNLGGEDNIVLDAVEEIILTNSTLNSEGDYGVIRLGSYIRANTINVDNSAIAAENKTGEGVAGDIYLDANDIIITNNSNISGDGIIGIIFVGTLNPTQTITIDNSQITAEEDLGEGFAGDIYLDANDITITNGSNISGNGDFGRIFIGSSRLPQTVTINNSIVETDSLNFGRAGFITIDASQEIRIENTFLTSQGSFGNISIGDSFSQTPQRVTINGSFITTDSFFDFENAGTITIEATQEIDIDNSSLTSQGSSGNISIGSDSSGFEDSPLPQRVTINGSSITTDGFFDIFDEFENAGTITIEATQEISIENSFLTSQGSFGNISVGNGFSQTPQRVTISDSTITTDSFPDFGFDDFNDFDSAGSITIDATQEISIENSFLTSQGSFGNISVGNGFSQTPQTVTINDSTITTDSFPDFNFDDFNDFDNAGSITIDATQEISIENSFLTSQGSFGNISIGNGFSQTPQTVTISDSTITTDSFPDFGFDDFNDFDSAGSITIDATQAISIENSFLTSQGSFGNISIGSDFFSFDDSQTLQRVTISNSFITTDDFENAGFISVSTENLILDGSQITSRTSGGAGNINLNITDSLLLLNRSEISTSGNDVFGEGGNINISARFVIVSSEDNDIHADAKGEKAGDVTITIDPDGFIFGIQERDQDTPLSDITATSDVEDGDGDISINNQQATDPSQGLIELPEEIAEESTFIVGGVCSIGGGSEFIVRGRGGVPYIPGLVTQNDVVNVDLVDEVLLPAPPPEAIKPHHRTDVTLIDSEGKEFKPAMGAVLLPDGMVEFVDYNPAEVYRDIYASASCSR